MAITIKDIARITNVSATTVSRVLNNKHEGVSLETRQRILDTIRELDYKPNAIARGLVTKKTNTIGIIIPDISNQFFSDIARGIEDGASDHGYNVFLCNTDDKLDKESKYINALKEKCVDGIIFASSSMPNIKIISELIKGSIPVVVVDRHVEIENVYGIYTDNFRGGYIATKHLIDLNHKKIGCITGPLGNHNSKERLDGYKQALLDSCITFNEDLVAEGNYKINGGMKAAEKLIRNKQITALFVSNDLMAYGAYKAIKAAGLNIPEDISIVGFDDTELSQIIEPELTTIRQPAYQMGIEAERALIKIISGKSVKDRNKSFSPNLIIRKSTSKYQAKII
jgi:LacI family transcriptional regulator